MAIHKYDIGTVIRVNVGIDVSGASSLKIRYQKPSGATGEWTATRTQGETTKIQYTTASNDLNESGTWKIQGYADLGSWKGTGDIVTLEVEMSITITS